MLMKLPCFRAASTLPRIALFCTLLLMTVPAVAVNATSETTSVDELATVEVTIRSAPPSFTPITDQKIRQAKNDLQKAVMTLDRELKKVGPVAQGWETYLVWNELKSTINSAQPDMEQLKKAYLALAASHRGLELACFVDLRLALEKYMNLRMAADNPAVKTAYDKQMAGFAEMLACYVAKPTSNPSDSLQQVVAWLDMFDQASDLLAELRTRFAKPNFYASASKRLIAPGFEDKVNEPVDIRDVILKTNVHSQGTMLGQTTLEMIPSETEAVLAVKLSGTTQTKNVGHRGPVWIHSDSTSQIAATKTITIDAEGLHTTSADSDVDTTTSIRSICDKNRRQIVENIAWKKACQSRPQAEAIASCRAKQRVSRQVDEKAAATLDKANQDYRKQFRSPLVHRKLFPSLLNFSTSTDRLSIVALQQGLAQFAAWSDPPKIDEAENDASIRIHESVVNNSTWTFLAGRTFAEEEFLSLVADLSGGEVPEQFKPDEDQTPWAVTFAKENPIRVTFADNQIQIEIRATSFKKGDTKYTAMNIATTYRIESKDGQFSLVRVGDLEIFPPDFKKQKRRLSAREQSLRTMLEKRFSKLFEPTWTSRPDVPLPKRWQSAGTLKLTGWQSSNGWMTLTWKLDK